MYIVTLRSEAANYIATMMAWIVIIILASLCAMVNSQVNLNHNDNCTIGGIDLVFVVDVSSSISESRFQLIREFTEELSMLLNINTQRSLVGVILFSDNAIVHFPITQYINASTLLPALNPGLPYSGGGTNTAAALDLLRTAGQTGGALELRPGYVPIAIVVTDGQSSDEQATLNAASALHASNIYEQVYAVGVSGADATELYAIASDASLVFFTSNFNSAELTQLQNNVTKELCSINITNVTVTIIGDPHFMVPLQSDEILCYSIQGYPGLTFNLIYNDDFIINALFIDSIGDEEEATWIGKLAVIPRHTNKSEAVIFDSVKQEVVLVDQGHFTASVVDKISYDESGKMSVKFTRGIAKQAGNPTVHVKYEKPLASFDVTFYSNHLDVNWDLKYDSVPNIHGLMGQFMVKGMAIDPMKKILTYPDAYGRDPVPVEKDDVMTGKTCWKAMNPGHQGEGLIKGSVLDYMVSNLLEDDFKLKYI